MATRRAKPATEEVPTLLIVGKEYFKEALKSRVLIGEEILRRQIQTREQLDISKKEVSDWDDYNSELLKQSFNKEHNEYKYDYDQVNSFYGLYERGTNKSILQEFQEQLDYKLTNLKQLLAKVDLIKSEITDEKRTLTGHRKN